MGVATAFAEGTLLLEAAGYGLDLQLSQPGFIRAIVRRDDLATRIDWAHDSAWRFMPLVPDAFGGFLLQEVDLAINKTLALAGRDERRDFVDIIFAHDRVLPLGALTWAAVGKDRGFTPLSLLEPLKRRGRHRPEDMARLDLTTPFDLQAGKELWLAALDDAQALARSRPAEEIGCLYHSDSRQRFEEPRPDADLASQGLSMRFGTPGGVLPRPADTSLAV